MNNNEWFSADYSYFFNIWPWMGLGAAVVVLILLLCTDWLRGDTTKSRWKDPFWLGWAFMVCYMLHNVEEYGFDLTGAHNGFPSAMAVIFGQPLAEYFFLTVNFSIVWIAAPLAAWIGRRKNWPVLATGMAGLMFINSFTHIISGFVGGYNPGLLTTLVIFIPITLWTFIVYFGKGGMPRRVCWWNIGIGLFYHIVMFGSIMPQVFSGNINMPLLTIIMGIDMVITFILWLALQKHAMKRS